MSKTFPSETSSYESSECDASTIIAKTEGPGDGSDDKQDMTTALDHLRFDQFRFEPTSLPSQEPTASTDFFEIRLEISMSESASSRVGSDHSVHTMSSLQFHMRTLFGVIDDFVPKYQRWLFSRINEFSKAADEALNLLYTGSRGETHYSSMSGSGSSPNSDQTNSIGTSLLSLIPGGGNRGNDEDDDGSLNQNLNPSIDQPHLSCPREFACPFYKRDHENREWRDCSTK